MKLDIILEENHKQQLRNLELERVRDLHQYQYLAMSYVFRGGIIRYYDHGHYSLLKGTC